MKKLFKAIRQNDLDEVKAIIEKKPTLVACVSTPPPKKDVGQSPLQVAIKVHSFDIANYLIDKDADVNFMESEDCGSSQRMPLLHDCIIGIFISMCYGMKNIEISDKYIMLLKKLLEHGADPNKRNTSDFAALDVCVHRASYVLDNEVYSNVHEFIEVQLERVLDLLLEYGAEFKTWADGNYLPYTKDFGTNKTRFIDDYEHDKNCDNDETARTRACIQKYCASHELKV